jgi:hypothetical protein
MRIEAYDFGSITIDGKTYGRDLKIVAGKIIPNWWRQEGHNVLPLDLEDVFQARPEVLVVGTGYSGLMAVSQQVKNRLRQLGIEIIAQPTAQACTTYNTVSATRPTAFAAHLTC